MFSFRTFTLPLNREIRASLQIIKGLGYRKSVYLCAKTGIGSPFFIGNLSFYFFLILTFLFKIFIISVDKVKNKTYRIFKTLYSFGSWRALRHRDFLPVNGQRTRSNAGVRRRVKLAVLLAREAAQREAEERAKAKEKENAKA